MDPRFRIRTKMSWIRNTGRQAGGSSDLLDMCRVPTIQYKKFAVVRLMMGGGGVDLLEVRDGPGLSAIQAPSQSTFVNTQLYTTCD
jgi:hypothetical protein